MRLSLRHVTTLRNSPFGEFTPSVVGRSWLLIAHGADPSREPGDGKIFTLQVLRVTICYSDLIHSFFCLALTKVEIDRLVGHLFDKDPPVL
jgi:hypothetical protein